MRPLLAVALLAASAAAFSAEPPPKPLTFAGGVETVYVDVFVTRDGAPVAGLTASDFEVRDQGVRQKARLEDHRRQPVTSTLVLDVSGSLTPEQLGHLRRAGETFLDGQREEDRLALVAFCHELRLMTPHTTDRVAVRRALARLSPGGSTALYDALYAGLVLPGVAERTVVVLLTDGQENLSVLRGEDLRRLVQESNALLHVVGLHEGPLEVYRGELVGSRLSDVAERKPENAHLALLGSLAEETGGRLWPARSHAALAATFRQVLDDMQARYVLAYEPAGVAREGLHRLEVKLRGRSGRLRARSGYFVAPAGSR